MHKLPSLNDLSIEMKVGQVIMGGFPDAQPDAATLAAVRDGSLGNIILFAYNCPSPASVASLTAMLQDTAPTPLLVAADQEGGAVTRLGPPATVMPSAMARGAADDVGLAARAAGVMAAEMRAVGINVGLVPVADVNSNPLNPVIGARSFGEDPYRVADFVAGTVRGLQGHGVAACAKHFPGHGDTAVDSHFGLPRCERELADLDNVELVPFRTAIVAGAHLVMSSHILFPALDPQRPSTLSRAILTDLLRGRLGFDGVVITDSMEMAGIMQERTTPEACVEAFAAGADIVCPSHHRADQAGAHSLILAALRSGDIPLRRLDEAVGRILRLKAWLAEAPPALDAALASVGSPAHLAVADEVAARSITLVRDAAGWVPLPEGVVGVIEFGETRLTPAEDRVRGGSALAGDLAHFRAVQPLSLPLTPDERDWDTARDLARRSHVVVLGTRAAALYPAQAALVREVLALGRPTVVVALRAPYDLLVFPEAPAFLAAYGDVPPSLNAVARVLVGDAAARGRLPVTLPGLYERGDGVMRTHRG
ncbi:MAG: glycoside hydrolase family 3 N-terminal domain-containing protein [Anaerolineae bacterium]